MSICAIPKTAQTCPRLGARPNAPIGNCSPPYVQAAFMVGFPSRAVRSALSAVRRNPAPNAAWARPYLHFKLQFKSLLEVC